MQITWIERKENNEEKRKNENDKQKIVVLNK